MRVLMVSPYPPIRDGIGTYAVQEVKRLLLDGDEVEVLSPQPSAAHHHLQLAGARGPLALAKRVGAYDRVIVQYHPDVFYPPGVGLAERVTITSGLVAACMRAGNVEFRIHEYKPDWATGPLRPVMRRLWKAARSVQVHTETERRSFCADHGLPLDAVQVVEHGAHFESRVDPAERAAIRADLGIDEGEFAFLSIGFIQPHKGFDRAVDAFAALGAAPGARLDVVGSVRVEDPGFVAYAEELRDRIEETPGAHLHSGYVSDEAFDRWLVAADCLVLPYRIIWSSGVIERARLYGTPVIATRVGGLAAQAPEGTWLVDDDAELRRAMASVLAGGAAPSPSVAVPAGVGGRWEPIVADPATVDRAAVQAALRARAGSRPGPATTTRPGAATRDRSAPRAVRSLPGLALPAPSSARRSGSIAKRLVHRLTYWQLAPIVHHVNQLQRATARDLDATHPDRSLSS